MKRLVSLFLSLGLVLNLFTGLFFSGFAQQADVRSSAHPDKELTDDTERKSDALSYGFSVAEIKEQNQRLDTLEFEIESLVRTQTDMPDGGPFINQIKSDSGASGGKFLHLQGGDGTGFTEYALPSIPPGTYAVYARHKTNIDRGIYNVLVAGALVGMLDGYDLENRFITVKIGEVCITQSDNITICFQGNGCNSSVSIPKYGMALDKLIFADPSEEIIPPTSDVSEIYDTAYEGYQETGNWFDSALANYKADVTTRYSNNAGAGIVTWSFLPPELGAGKDANYTLYVWLPAHNNATKDAVYKIESLGETWSRIVNQNGTGNWHELANIPAQGEVGITVTLSAANGNRYATALKAVLTEKSADQPDGSGPVEPSKKVAVLVNQTGYDAEGIKRATIPNVPDGTPFQVFTKDGDFAVYEGVVEGGIADFSKFSPSFKGDYYIKCSEAQSYEFTVANNWITSVSAPLALAFMNESRSDTWEPGKGSVAWRDSHQFSFEMSSLVLQYLANPSLYDNMPYSIVHTDSSIAHNLHQQDEPDIIWLIQFAAERYYDYNVNQNYNLHALTKAQMAYYLYAYPYMKQYIPEADYLRLRDWTIEQWSNPLCNLQYHAVAGEKHNLFEVQIAVGEIKGAFPPATTIAPNLMMYEVCKRDGLADADKFLSSAIDNGTYLLENYDLSSTAMTAGQRMSEHAVMENLTFLMECYPEHAPDGLFAAIEEWADKAIARADNMWDYRKAADPAAGDGEDYWTGGTWAKDHGQWSSVMNEPGQVIGAQPIGLAVGRIVGGERANRLREIGVSAIDNMFGRNPQNRMFFYTVSEIPGGDKGWWKKYAGGNGILGEVPGRIDGSPKEDSYPYNPDGIEGYTEGWVAYNTVWNTGLAYHAADKTEIYANTAQAAVGEAVTVTLYCNANIDYNSVETVTVNVYDRLTDSWDTLTLTENAADGSYFEGIYTPTVMGDLEFSYGYDFFRKATDVVVTGGSFTPVSSITLDRTKLALSAGTVDIIAVTDIQPEDATFKKLRWESSNPAIATVDQNGTVTALTEGTAEISVFSVNDTASAKVQLTVTAAVPLEIAALISPASIGLGENAVITITGVRYSNGTIKQADTGSEQFKSANSSVATVDNDGNVKGISPGTTEISIQATLSGEAFSGKVKVTVTPTVTMVDYKTALRTTSPDSEGLDDAPQTPVPLITFKPTKSGEWLEFETPVLPAGKYLVRTRTKYYSSYGKYQLDVDGTDVGGVVDYSDNSVGEFYVREFDTELTFAASEKHKIRYTAVDKGSSNYHLAVDYIEFVQIEKIDAPMPPIHKMDDMYALTFRNSTGSLNYRLYVPADYDASRQYPVLTYLNGAGSRGTDNTKQLNNLGPVISPLIDNAAFPCIIVVPQLPTSKQWVNTPFVGGSYSIDDIAESESVTLLIGLLDALAESYNIDADRLYLMGQSMGGYGTWDTILRYPDKFAAAIPMCGAGDPKNAGRIADMPLFVWHGNADPSVPVSGSREMAAALKEQNAANLTYLEFNGMDHYIQRRLFEQPELWISWLFSQQKGLSGSAPDIDSMYLYNPEHSFNFNSSLPDSWRFDATGTGSVWNISGSQLSLNVPTGSEGVALFDTELQLGKAQITGFYTIPAGISTGGGGPVFHYKDNDNYWHVRLTKDGVELLQKNNGTMKVIHTRQYDYVKGRIACLRIELDVRNIHVSLDGVSLISYTMQTDPAPTGKTGIRYYAGTALVDDFMVCEGAAIQAPLSLTAPNDRQVIQRNAQGEAQISLLGQVHLTEAQKVQACVADFVTGDTVIDWADAVLDDNSYSTTITVPQGGWYRAKVRILDTSNNVLHELAGDARWGVGINILCIGQSNMAGYGQNGNYTIADDHVSTFMNEIWAHLKDPFSAGDQSISKNSAAGGSMVPAIGNILTKKYDVPIGFIPAAQSGSNLFAEFDGWLKRNEADPADRSNLYGNSLYRAKEAGGIEFIIMNQGENNVSRKSNSADYEEGMRQLLQNYCNDLGYAVPIIYCQLGAMKASSWDDSHSQFMTGIRTAQLNINDGENLILGAVELDLERNNDNLHYTTESQKVIGARIANAIQYLLGDSGYYCGPSIISADFASENHKMIEVVLAHTGGTDFTPNDSITGFVVRDGSGNISIANAAKQNASTILLTLDRSAEKDAEIAYMQGLLPDTSGIVKDNSPLALPLNATPGYIAVGDASSAPIDVIVSEGSYILSKIYDGTTSAAIARGTLSVEGILPEDNEVMVVATPADYPAADVDTYSVPVILSLSGNGAEKYCLVQNNLSLTAVITKAPATGIGKELYVQAEQAKTYEIRLDDLFPSGMDTAQISGFQIHSGADCAVFTENAFIHGRSLFIPMAVSSPQQNAASIAIGFESRNYTISDVDVIIHIAGKIPVEISGIIIEDRPYNGIALSWSGTPVFQNAVDGSPVFGLIPCYIWSSGSAPVNSGSYTLTVTADGGSLYSVAPLTLPATIKKAVQEIIFTLPESLPAGGQQKLEAAASSGLALQYHSSDPSIASIEDDMLKLLQPGVVHITASQAGDHNHLPAQEIVRSITVTQSEPVLPHLSSLSVRGGKLHPSFDPEVTNYRVNIDNSVSQLEIAATSSDGEVYGTGIHNIPVGESILTLTVLAKDGAAGIYTIKVYREAPRSSSSNSSSGSSTQDTNKKSATVSKPSILSAANAVEKANKARTEGDTVIHTRHTGHYAVSAESFAKLAGLRYQHDTVEGNTVQMRLTIAHIPAITNTLITSGYVRGSAVEQVQNFFSKWFDNQIRVIHLDQSGAWGSRVKIAAKVDLASIDSETLYFYSFDCKANSYQRIQNSDYHIDENGYLHFYTELAGDIVVSEGALVRFR